MARRKVPEVSPEERERRRRVAAEEQRERAAAAAKAMTETARRVLGAQGMPLERADVGARMRWMVSRRVELGFQRLCVQASAPAYRPTARQVAARPCDGIYEEIEF